MPRRSAGLLAYRRGAGAPASGEIEVLLVHPGGPLWARRDDGWWSVPKGEMAPGEAPPSAADREFAEELGLPPPPGPRIPLGEVVQAGGKHVVAFAVEADVDVATLSPGTTEIEWPPRSGKRLSIPEVDRAEWFPIGAARRKLLAGQQPFLDRLEERLRAAPRPSG